MDPADRKRLGKAGVTRAEAIEKAALRSERDLQNQIANYLRLHGIWFDQDAMHKRRTGTTGTPDFLFAINGRACAIEAKFGDGDLKPAQVAAIAAMKKDRWRVVVVKSLPEVISFLKEVSTNELQS
jgi:predicted Ser/Thr protein kinase